MATTGSELLGKALRHHGADTMFFLMGGPMHIAVKTAMAEGIRAIDVRHEQAAAMMATAYARVLNRPGVCMACSGPGTMNLGTGLAHAFVDCVPLVAIGGASPIRQSGLGAFQEVHQVAAMRPITKWAERVYEARRIPELVGAAFRKASSGKPGPVYLDFPADILAASVDEKDVWWPTSAGKVERDRPHAAEPLIDRAIELIAECEKPVVLSGSGVLWSDAIEELRAWVELTGMPFYTTPQGRGVVPEDHSYFYPYARSVAFKEADLVLVVGTRMNYVSSFVRAPRFNATARLIRIDIDADEITSSQRLNLGIVGDAKAILTQLASAVQNKRLSGRFEAWRKHLAAIDADKKADQERKLSNNDVPIHPLRLCKEIRDFIKRDAILAVDGRDILNFARQSIPTFEARHRLNSGTLGTMGVGLPFGIGAKVAKPGTQVVVLNGDGSFGMNAMELDTAARHKIGIITVISLNGGWCADPDRSRPGRDLGYTRFDKTAESLACHGEYVEKPADIRPALERAADFAERGIPALVNVMTDWRASSAEQMYAAYST
jgi:thiamine pyrophosphate-dependent acetolactate synthase large subunit-like protein